MPIAARTPRMAGTVINVWLLQRGTRNRVHVTLKQPDWLRDAPGNREIGFVGQARRWCQYEAPTVYRAWFVRAAADAKVKVTCKHCRLIVDEMRRDLAKVL